MPNMSLYSRMHELRPLPTPDDYDLAHKITDESFGAMGSWGDVTDEFAQIARDKTLRAELDVVAEFGYLLRGKELSKEGTDHEKPYMVGRALAQGFSQQLHPSQLLFSRKLTRLQSLKILNTHYMAQNFDRLKDADEVEVFNSEYVSALGQYGLSKIGNEATDYIDKWATEAYPLDKRLATVFKLGHGMMVVCGVVYQTKLNEQLIEMGHTNVDLDQEVQEIIFSSTSE